MGTSYYLKDKQSLFTIPSKLKKCIIGEGVSGTKPELPASVGGEAGRKRVNLASRREAVQQREAAQPRSPWAAQPRAQSRQI